MGCPPSPTVVSLDWDYGYASVLTDRSPGVHEVRCLDPWELGLSDGLTTRLQAWLARAEAHSARWVRDDPLTEDARSVEEQLERDFVSLAYDVAHELGPDVGVLVRGREIEAARHRR